jgi:glycosyltransferase involved in cell wall biosynthesis
LRGNNVTIITRRLSRDLPPNEVINGIPVRRLAPVGLSSLANGIMVFRLALYLWRHWAEWDILHSFTLGPVGLAAILAGSLSRKPVIVRAATYGDINRQGGKSLGNHLVRQVLVPPRLWNFFLNRASVIVAISQEIMQEGIDFGVGQRMIYIPNSVDTAQFSLPTPQEKNALREKLSLPLAVPLLVYTGRLVYRKRLDVLIRAMPQILTQHPQTRLLIVGGGHQHADDVGDELLQLTTQLGVEQSVQFTGIVDNVPDYLRAGDVYVFPSQREGLPNAVLEATACGLPIVASRIGGVVDVLSDEEAWLVPVGDVEGFAQAVVDVLSNPALAAQKAQRAQERVEKDFSMAHITDVYESLYRDLLRR